MLICNKLYLFITVAGNQRLSGVEKISKQKGSMFKRTKEMRWGRVETLANVS